MGLIEEGEKGIRKKKLENERGGLKRMREGACKVKRKIKIRLDAGETKDKNEHKKK